jgi:hypothetical protein
MAKENKGNNGGQQEQQLSARDRYRSRYSSAHPDLNLDDDEAFYTQANANLDELEKFRKSDKELGEVFERVPVLAGLLLAAREGQNPFTYLAENIGPDMDIRELANNPEFGKTMGEALAKFQEKQAQGAKAEKEIGENMGKSFDALKELQGERGMSDEDCIALVKKLFGEVDENGEVVEPGIIGNASKGIVPKEVWEAVLKAQNYDGDIAAATDKARATALNEKVQNNLRDMGGTGLPAAMPTGGSARGERRKKNDGSLKAFQESLGV